MGKTNKNFRVTTYNKKNDVENENFLDVSKLQLKISQDKTKFIIFILCLILFSISLIFAVTMIIILPFVSKDIHHNNTIKPDNLNYKNFTIEEAKNVLPFTSDELLLVQNNSFTSTDFNNFSFFSADIHLFVQDTLNNYPPREIFWNISLQPIFKLINIPSSLPTNKNIFPWCISLFSSSINLPGPNLILALEKTKNKDISLVLFSVALHSSIKNIGYLYSIGSIVKLDFHFYKKSNENY